MKKVIQVIFVIVVVATAVISGGYLYLQCQMEKELRKAVSEVGEEAFKSFLETVEDAKSTESTRK